MVVALLMATCLTQATCQCYRRSASTAFHQYLETFFFREISLWRCFSFLWWRSRALGFSMAVPSLATKSLLMPRSTPMVGPATGTGSTVSSTTLMATNHRPARSEMVAELT